MLLSHNGLVKISSAILAMAQSQESLQQRLTEAGVHYLGNISPERDLPSEDLRNKFEAIYKALTCLPSDGNGKIEATVAAMDDDEVRRHIESIAKLRTELAEYLTINDGRV